VIERPILFSGSMVRAILEGRKTQTRRLVRLADDVVKVVVDPGGTWLFGPGPYIKAHRPDSEDEHVYPRIRCPCGYPASAWAAAGYAPVADRLWVRETFEVIAHGPAFGLRIRYADGVERVIDAAPDRDDRWRPLNWRRRASIHMPRWASRLTLEVLSVAAERLHAITEGDALAEGLSLAEFPAGWDALNSRRAPWRANPWVWRIEFKPVTP
jgi:hypothetical protein